MFYILITNFCVLQGAEVEVYGQVWNHANEYAIEQSKKPGDNKLSSSPPPP